MSRERLSKSLRRGIFFVLATPPLSLSTMFSIFFFLFLQSFFAFFLAGAYCLLGIVLDGWSRNSPIELKILYEPRDAPFHCRRIIGFSGIRREFETNSDVNDRCKLSSSSSDGARLFLPRDINSWIFRILFSFFSFFFVYVLYVPVVCGKFSSIVNRFRTLCDVRFYEYL